MLFRHYDTRDWDSKDFLIYSILMFIVSSIFLWYYSSEVPIPGSWQEKSYFEVIGCWWLCLILIICIGSYKLYKWFTW